MSDGRELVRRARVPVPVQRREDRSVLLVAEAVQLLEQLAGPALVEAVLRVGRERPERLEVVVEPPRLGVEARELAAVQLDRGLLPAEEAVAGQLDLERDRIAAGRAPHEHRVEVVPVQALHRYAVEPERRLARRVPQQLDARARPRLRDGRAHAEPVRRPERSEPLAERRRPVVERLRLVVRDAVDLRADEQLVDRRRLRVDLRTQPRRGLREARARVLRVADH